MKKKKPETWYGVRTITQDLRVSEVKVAKETATRIYLHKDSQIGLLSFTTYLNKLSGYEQWFRDRDKAVATKLKWLRRNLRDAKENSAQAKKNLTEFESANA